MHTGLSTQRHLWCLLLCKETVNNGASHMVRSSVRTGQLGLGKSGSILRFLPVTWAHVYRCKRDQEVPVLPHSEAKYPQTQIPSKCPLSAV